jgi:hypothetical protein
MDKKRALFIAATGQNVGKTTLCLGLIANLQNHFNKVGFIKPVGQQHVKVDGDINVDKDVVLFKKHFNLSADWNDMSPVIIPNGFTRDYLDQKVNEEHLEKSIISSFNKIYNENDYTIVEGTGHVGVGSIINLNNAKVASTLGLDVVLIASGGLGSSHDELALNIEMCHSYGIKVRGIILNKVLEDKRDMILDYVPKSLKKWNIPLLGCVPYNAFLNTPAIKDFESLFKTRLLAGEQFKYRHFQNTRLVAGSREAYISEMQPNELVITPASREDIILATLEKHKESLEKDGLDYQGGFILTSTPEPTPEIIEAIRKSDIPALYAPLCSYDAMKMITNFIAKIRTEDVLKVDKAIKLVEENVNFDLLVNPV